MYIINNSPVNEMMIKSNSINFRQNNNLSTAFQPVQSNFLKYSNVNKKNKNVNNKNITFSSIEQFLHYKMTGRKPHPKVKFTPQEDDLLRNLVQQYGENDNWSIIAKKMTISYRNQRQCKERWLNYLSPSINNAPFTLEEDEKLEELYSKYGAKWVQIAKYFPSRTDINIRSRWLVLQRRKKKLESKQSSDDMLLSPVSTDQDQNIIQFDNIRSNKNLNLPVPQIKQNLIEQKTSLINEPFYEHLNSTDIQNAISNDQIPMELLNNIEDPSLCGNVFALEEEKNFLIEENFYNLTPVELTTNDLNNFEDWTF